MTEEIENTLVEETANINDTQVDNAVDGENVTEDENVTETPKKRRSIKELIAYIQSHEELRQMVLFLLFSMICGASQLIITYALSAGLKLAPALQPNFLWFIFKYDTIAEFIGFLVGSIVGQVLTFVLNRKKTFKATNNIVISAIMYTILAILIIIMQTYLGGLVTSACWAAKQDASGFLALLFNLAGQIVAGIAALIISFLGNKFLVMRSWGKKKDAQTSEEKEAEVQQ